MAAEKQKAKTLFQDLDVDGDFRAGPDIDPFIKYDSRAGTLTFPRGSGSAAGVLGGSLWTLTGEKSGIAVGNGLSFGNGQATPYGVVAPFACKLYAMSLWVDTSAFTGDVTVRAAVDGVDNASYALTVAIAAARAAGSIDFLSSPLSIAAGETVNMEVAATPGAVSVKGLMLFKID